MINYKGLFYKEDTKKHYYEGGAHFRYKDLVKALETLKNKIDEEESEKNTHSRNRSIDYFRDKQINILKNPISNLKTIDKNYNPLESPGKSHKNNNHYIEELLSLDNIKKSKKRKIKLKEIKTDSRQKEKEGSLYTENNRYNINNDVKIRNKSLDLNLLKEKDNYSNKILLTEDIYNNKNIHNLKLVHGSNPKSYKNLYSLSSLPKIESLYFNNIYISNRNSVDNNSNLATDSTNKKSVFKDPNSKMELEINKNLNMADFNIFSLKKKKLPQINLQSLSTINSNNQNKITDKNRLLFTINKRNKETNLLKLKNDNNEIYGSIDIKNNIKNNNYQILKLTDSDKDKDSEKKTKKKDLKSVIFHNKNKSHRKSVKKNDEE